MKKDILQLLVVLFFAMFVIGSVDVMAAQSYSPSYYYNQHYSWHKAQCAKYLTLANQALKNNDLKQAEILAQKAIQSDAYNKIAWQTYDSIIVKISGKNASNSSEFSATQSSQTPLSQSSMPKAPSGGSAFQGC